MGGHHAGEIASATVIEEFATLAGRPSLTIDDVHAAFVRARTRVESLPPGAGAGAGTTLSGVVIADVDGEGYWLALNLGDSRTYRLSRRRARAGERRPLGGAGAHRQRPARRRRCRAGLATQRHHPRDRRGQRRRAGLLAHPRRAGRPHPGVLRWPAERARCRRHPRHPARRDGPAACRDATRERGGPPRRARQHHRAGGGCRGRPLARGGSTTTTRRRRRSSPTRSTATRARARSPEEVPDVAPLLPGQTPVVVTPSASSCSTAGTPASLAARIRTPRRRRPRARRRHRGADRRPTARRSRPSRPSPWRSSRGSRALRRPRRPHARRRGEGAVDEISGSGVTTWTERVIPRPSRGSRSPSAGRIAGGAADPRRGGARLGDRVGAAARPSPVGGLDQRPVVERPAASFREARPVRRRSGPTAGSRSCGARRSGSAGGCPSVRRPRGGRPSEPS